MESTFPILFIIVILAFFYKIIQLNKERAEHKKSIEDAQLKYDTLYTQKKSSEVRTGQIAEKLAPLLNEFPKDAQEEDIISLGMPIDYLIFGPEYIDFVEVKSGKSKLSTKQKRIRDQVQQRLVRWKLVRIA